MTDNGPVTMESIAAGLRVKDLPASIAFYVDKLGFRNVYSNERYCVLDREGVSIHLTDKESGGAPGFCTIFVKGVDTLYADCVAKGITIAREIEDSPYGLRDFVMHDLDDSEILIGQSTE